MKRVFPLALVLTVLLTACSEIQPSSSAPASTPVPAVSSEIPSAIETPAPTPESVESTDVTSAEPESQPEESAQSHILSAYFTLPEDMDSVERYLKEVRDALVCPEPEKKKFMTDFSENVCAYVSDNPTVQKDDLYARFGSPEEIGESFAYAEDQAIVQNNLKSHRRQRLFLRLLVVLATIAVLLLGVFVIDTCLYNHGETVLEGPVEGVPPADTDAWATY